MLFRSKVGGVPGIVRHGQTGFLLEPDDLDGLTAALARLVRNPRLRTEMGRRARAYVEENHSLQRLPVHLSELYQMVADFLSRLLPACTGSLYIYANSRDVLESAKAWNGGRMMPAMHPADCWGLRRGRPYTFGENEIDFVCAMSTLR